MNEDREIVNIFFTGFRQNWKEPTGLELAWREVRKLSKPNCWILPPMEWNCDVEALAQLVMRNVTNKAYISVYAYSWGGGWAFPRFAAVLKEYGYSIDLAVLVDAVYRSNTLPDWLPANLTSLFRTPKIKIPDNVKQVYQFRQNKTIPKGHDLELGKKTKLINVEVLPMGHTEIDNAIEVKTAIIEFAKTISNYKTTYMVDHESFRLIIQNIIWLDNHGFLPLKELYEAIELGQEEFTVYLLEQMAECYEYMDREREE